MLNNILNGWRPAITKLIIIGLVLYFVAKSVLASSIIVDSKWACGASLEIGTSLKSSGEEIIATGAVDDMFIMSFWANKETREWTLVLTDNGNKELSCVVAYGSKLKTITSNRVAI